MENPWSLLAVLKCSRSQSTRKTGRSSAGQRYKCCSSPRLLRNPSGILSLTRLFGAGVLPAKGVSAQRRSKRLRGTQPANRAARPGLLLGTVSTPQTAERGWDGQTGPAHHFWSTRGQRACLLFMYWYYVHHISLLSNLNITEKCNRLCRDWIGMVCIFRWDFWLGAMGSLSLPSTWTSWTICLLPSFPAGGAREATSL